MHADVLPLPERPESVSISGETVLLMQSLQTSVTNNFQPIAAVDHTRPNIFQLKVYRLLLQGWQLSNDPELKPYQVRYSELSVWVCYVGESCCCSTSWA